MRYCKVCKMWVDNIRYHQRLHGDPNCIDWKKGYYDNGSKIIIPYPVHRRPSKEVADLLWENELIRRIKQLEEFVGKNKKIIIKIIECD